MCMCVATYVCSYTAVSIAFVVARNENTKIRWQLKFIIIQNATEFGEAGFYSYIASYNEVCTPHHWVILHDIKSI